MTTRLEPSYRKRVGYQAMLLGVFSTLATVLLVAGNMATRDAIAARQQEDLLASLSEVVPPDHYDNNILAAPLQLKDASGHTLTVYRGTRDGAVTALAYEVVGKGYAGDIRVLLGVDGEGVVIGARVLAHTETPGLGDRIEVARDDWILAFDGLSIGNPPLSAWKVKKDGGQFDQFSGATITPRAVVEAIVGGLHLFHEQRDTLLYLSPAANQDDSETEHAA